ncbi:MAG: RNA-binding domain-containing protein [Candidatus Thalassarchaeaceae archaeon]|jgi:RNA binding exosome subunit|nr:RNA-binding domain-containing protein [Candidatus Thalassarchaeaceae archaeon]MDP6318024.1 RNA-binding domain-containing protein [Candidatus Thalassarchaeaceae archaeon]HJM29719.1 RNA-binding domain-containing protein [Candidatus Thalassarchaeaceae archaeon]HJN70316.1 RNA-binding domain-containing protein [Candidatus Thalassarchaeaceae archaeon]|tara:strand:- start:7844 stop:8278 length:435 start_codon:yes stop_codon:yes gene_type:complete
MSLHSAVWRVHCSAVDDLGLIENALLSLSNGQGEVIHEKSKSYHGAPQTLLELTISRKKNAKESFLSLGREVLETIIEGDIATYIDEDKTLHLRLDIDELVQGNVRIATGSTRKIGVKGKFKIEAYPGQNPEEIVSSLITDNLA